MLIRAYDLRKAVNTYVPNDEKLKNCIIVEQEWEKVKHLILVQNCYNIFIWVDIHYCIVHPSNLFVCFESNIILLICLTLISLTLISIFLNVEKYPLRLKKLFPAAQEIEIFFGNTTIKPLKRNRTRSLVCWTPASSFHG